MLPTTFHSKLQKELEFSQNDLLADRENSCLSPEAFEKIEFLKEMIASLEQQLVETQQQLLATEKELIYTNHELCAALLPSERLTFNQARELAKQLLAKNTSASYCLAILMSAIYKSPVDVRELEPKCGRKSNETRRRDNPPKNEISDRREPAIQDECDKLGDRVLMQLALVERLNSQTDIFKSQISKKRKAK